MPIKRVTIELDDSVDQTSPTSAPESLTHPKPEHLKDSTPSSIPDYSEDESNTSKIVSGSQIKKIGRTFPDLIIEFMDKPRAMSTILMFVPFIIFANKINSFYTFKYPIALGSILNFIWFCCPPIVKSISHILSKIK